MKAGLCESCRHQKLIRSGRGSVFSMCERHKTDDSFPKYPRLPVLECRGYEKRELRAHPAEPGASPKGASESR